MADYRYPSPTKGGASIRIVLALIGIAVNVLLSFVMGKVGMPLFFNNFGTITVAAVGGLFPGIFTAVMTSAICGIYYTEAVYFGFLNAIIAIYTVWYIRKFSFKKFSKVLLYVVIGAFFAGTVSTLMNWNLLDGATVARNSESTVLFATAIGGNLFMAYYIYVLIRYLLDLGISAAVAVILLSVVIPKSYQNKFERGNWKQKPLSKEEIADLKWKIEKANYDTEYVHWSYDKPFTYDAYEKSIVLRNVPKSIDVRYRDNKAIAVGTYTAKAYLTYDSDNYNAPEIDTTIDWAIVSGDREY